MTEIEKKQTALNEAYMKRRTELGLGSGENREEVKDIFRNASPEKQRTDGMNASLADIGTLDKVDKLLAFAKNLQSGLREFRRPPATISDEVYETCCDNLLAIANQLKEPSSPQCTVSIPEPIIFQCVDNMLLVAVSQPRRSSLEARLQVLLPLLDGCCRGGSRHVIQQFWEAS